MSKKLFSGCMKLKFIDVNDDVKVHIETFGDWFAKSKAILRKKRKFYVNVYVHLQSGKIVLLSKCVHTFIDRVQVAEFIKQSWRDAVEDLDEPIRLYDSYITLSA